MSPQQHRRVLHQRFLYKVRHLVEQNLNLLLTNTYVLGITRAKYHPFTFVSEAQEEWSHIKILVSHHKEKDKTKEDTFSCSAKLRLDPQVWWLVVRTVFWMLHPLQMLFETKEPWRLSQGRWLPRGKLLYYFVNHKNVKFTHMIQHHIVSYHAPPTSILNLIAYDGQKREWKIGGTTFLG